MAGAGRDAAVSLAGVEAYIQMLKATYKRLKDSRLVTQVLEDQEPTQEMKVEFETILASAAATTLAERATETVVTSIARTSRTPQFLTTGDLRHLSILTDPNDLARSLGIAAKISLEYCDDGLAFGPPRDRRGSARDERGKRGSFRGSTRGSARGRGSLRRGNPRGGSYRGGARRTPPPTAVPEGDALSTGDLTVEQRAEILAKLDAQETGTVTE